MKFIDLINKRYSVRAYNNTPVEDEKLQYILTAGRLAPTAGNRQPFQIIVVHTKGRENELLTIYQRDWFITAPLIICICGFPAAAWSRNDGKPYLDVDVAIVMDYMILAATEMGLGTCFVASFDIMNTKKVLSLPEDVEPLLFTPLGYPDDKPGIKVRKNLEDLVRYERW